MIGKGLRSVQEQGRDYERELAQRYGGSEQPNSGAGPRFKLDWKLGSLLFSAKHTKHESFTLKAADLREALAGAQGPGGRGEIPAMAIRMEGFPDDVFVLRGSDLRALLEGDVEAPVQFVTGKRAAKLAAARAR
jgi:hypothetical protein